MHDREPINLAIIRQGGMTKPMKLDLRILIPQDKGSLLELAKRQLRAQVAEPMECEMQSWNARWRAEALDHYLQQGWSYGAFVEGVLQGFLLGQPLIFYRGMTQTLWLEHLECSSDETARELLEGAYRWARDKHFQCVLTDENPRMRALVGDWKQTQPAGAAFIEIKSSRY